MDIYSTAILLSILVYIAVGNYAGRRVKHLDDYFVVGRNAPTLLIVGTLVASVLSTNAFLGETGFAYGTQAGSFILWPPLWTAGYIYGALFFGRHLRRSQALTVADYFGRRFNSHRVQAAAGVTIVLGLGGYLLTVTQGAAVVLSQITPLTYSQSLVAAWVSYTLFTLYSGSQGVVITDTLMFLLFTVMSYLALFYILDAHGGWLTALERLVRLEEKPDLMAWHGIVGPGTDFPSPMDYMIWSLIIGIAWSLVAAISPWQSSRYLMARNERVVVRSACIAAVSVALIQVMLFAAAATVNLSKPDIEPHEQTMVWAALNILSPVMGALLLAGIMAAALSSATTFLSLVGFSVSNDILAHAGKDDRAMLLFSRQVMLLVGVAALAISLFIPPNLFWLVYFVGTVFASSWGPVAFMSVWSDRITASAAFWGIISGFVGNVAPKFFDTIGWIELPSYLDPILIGGVISLIVIVVVSRFGSVTEAERSYRLSLHEVPPEERRPARRGTALGMPLLLVGFGVAMTAGMIRFYVRPYQSATSDSGGGFDWFSGEALAAEGWTVLFVLCGILTYHVLRRSGQFRDDDAGPARRADPAQVEDSGDRGK